MKENRSTRGIVADLARERFARDLDQKQKFAFAFAKRSQDVPEVKQRFARDLENAKKFAFAFAKRSSGEENLVDPEFCDLSASESAEVMCCTPEMGEEERSARFARDLENNKKFAFAFAKRSVEDEIRSRFARSPMDEPRFAFEFAKRGDDGRLIRFARPSFA
ncbi:hypothetical protein Y032_0132g1741 [Ancylostoma ceylanicum]|nr:hypothetical protein Y032_0132g1741 [Ancylostoma ceylanicum]